MWGWIHSAYQFCLIPLNNISVLPLVLLHCQLGVLHLNVVCQVIHYIEKTKQQCWGYTLHHQIQGGYCPRQHLKGGTIMTPHDLTDTDWTASAHEYPCQRGYRRSRGAGFSPCSQQTQTENKSLTLFLMKSALWLGENHLSLNYTFFKITFLYLWTMKCKKTFEWGFSK